MNKAKVRDGRIELMRFVASIFIMIGHMGYINCSKTRPFEGAWFYVEFFLILTGYFTARHFLSGKASGENKVKVSVDYTLKKFIRFLPYTTGAVLVWYLFKMLPDLQAEHLGALKSLEDMPFEMLFLSAANTNGSHLFTIWFLSAMFLTLPALCLILQISNKYIVLLLSFYFSVIYYLFRYDYGSHVYPNQMIRVFCGMMLGVLVYFVSQKLREKELSRALKAVLSVIEILAVLFPIITAGLNISVLRFDLLAFFVSSVLIFSGQTFNSTLSNPFFSYLGKISMPIYIWHLAVSAVVQYYFPNSSDHVRIFLFFAGTMVISIVNDSAVTLVKKKCKSRS